MLAEVELAVPGLRVALRGCLQRDQGLRWGSAAELDEALDIARAKNPGPGVQRWLASLPARAIFAAPAEDDELPWLPDACVDTWRWPERPRLVSPRQELPEPRRKAWGWPWRKVAQAC